MLLISFSPFRKISKIVVDICHKPAIIKLMTYAINDDKEVNCMPGRDGTGPAGGGPMTGRGLGRCGSAGETVSGTGLGMGFGRRGGRGRGLGICRFFGRDSKELLEQEKSVLKGRLEAIDKQLKEL